MRVSVGVGVRVMITTNKVRVGLAAGVGEDSGVAVAADVRVAAGGVAVGGRTVCVLAGVGDDSLGAGQVMLATGVISETSIVSKRSSISSARGSSSTITSRMMPRPITGTRRSVCSAL
jgi:hypothetical protein